ncbi:MAG: hypothetical protein HZC05_01060 [Candidatus Magasanikbacteria bacterium]|nr:hypothetical protein [Candidatus Magasanikbacteria bacterium]
MGATGGIVIPGETKLLAAFNFSAYGAPITVTSLTVDTLGSGGSLSNEDNLLVKFGKFQLRNGEGTILADGLITDKGEKLVFSGFSQIVPVSNGFPFKFLISADISYASLGGINYQFNINKASYIGSDAQLIQAAFPISYGPINIIDNVLSVLEVSWSPFTPMGVAAPSFKQIVAQLNFVAKASALSPVPDIIIDSLAVAVTSTFPVTDWQLHKGTPDSSVLAKGLIDGVKVNFSGFASSMPIASAETFYITANTTQAKVNSSMGIGGIQSAADVGTNTDATIKAVLPMPWKAFVY